MKAVSYKRILAYLIDIFIVTVISSLLTMFIPVTEEYQKANDEFQDVMEKFVNNEIENEDYLLKINDISYVINKESISFSVVSVVITIIYFVVFAYYMNGQTVGKKIMKIKIISTDDSKLTMNKLLIRSLIIDSILLNIISILTILFMNKSLYIKTYEISSTIFMWVYAATFAMILFRKDGRGLHDLLAKTIVVSSEENIISEASIVNEDVK